MATPAEMAASMLANMKEKTGKTLDAWLEIVKKTKLTKHGEILNMLKSEHGVTHGFASLIAHRALQGDAATATGDDLVERQYAGAKQDLRPIYDTLIRAVNKFGKDVEVSPKKSYVSLRRNKQFAIVQPSTKTRIDVGINLKEAEETSRLEASGSFSSMVSHRVRLTDRQQIDTELLVWLKQAYEAS